MQFGVAFFCLLVAGGRRGQFYHYSPQFYDDTHVLPFSCPRASHESNESFHTLSRTRDGSRIIGYCRIQAIARQEVCTGGHHGRIGSLWRCRPLEQSISSAPLAGANQTAGVVRKPVFLRRASSSSLRTWDQRASQSWGTGSRERQRRAHQLDKDGHQLGDVHQSRRVNLHAVLLLAPVPARHGLRRLLLLL